jgi:hypothetical protein
VTSSFELGGAWLPQVWRMNLINAARRSSRVMPSYAAGTVMAPS